MNRIFKEYNKTKSAETKINTEKDEAKKEYDQRTVTYKKALDDVNGLTRQLDQPSLSGEARAAKAKERDSKIAAIKKLEREINDFRTQREKELQARAMEMRESIVAEMTAAIKRLGGADNLVLDKSGTSSSGVPLLIFSPGRTDMSDRVITALNKSSSASDSPFDATRGLRFAVIDMNRAFTEYNKTKQAEKALNDARDAAKKEYDDRADNYKNALNEINKLNTRIDATRSDSDRTKLSKERDDKIANLKNMEREINEFRQTRESQLQEQRKRMLESLVKEITDVVTEKVKANSGDFVLDTSGTGTGGAPIVLFSNGVTDLTNGVVVTLNGGHGSAGSSETWSTSRKLRFAVVDLNRAFKEWPETKGEEAKINAARAAAKKDYDARTEAYKKALDELNELNRRLESQSLTTEAKTATAKIRDEKVASIKTLEKETNDYRQAREKELTDQATKMREAIVATIRSAINSCAERENFNIVFDSSGTSLSGVPLLVLAHDLPDITDKVLKR
jgi:outer membrane protein